MIEVKHLNKSFNEQQVLFDINLELKPGKNNLIIGQSGSGKTVLMKCLVGLISPDSGEILFNNRNFLSTDNREDLSSIRKEIGMVFQNGALFDSLSVLENVIFPLNMFAKMNPEEKIDRAHECLSRVNLSNINKLFPSELSGGMRKRVAIARAIAIKPKYLFCDEPNSGLDPKTSTLIDQLIAEITEEYHITTVINTHDMNSVLQIGDNVHFIFEGKLWWQGNKRNILETDNPEMRHFLEASELTRRILHNINTQNS
ncbi:MAG: ATP-binding cassette domain-containing protein [Bacteroidales bacterium]